jgi:hypothetical protein
MNRSILDFSEVTRIYQNTKNLAVVLNEIECRSITNLLKITSRFFQILDREDPDQRDISRRLWLLKETVQTTFLPFDTKSLGLADQIAELSNAIVGLPEAEKFVEDLKQIIDVLIVTSVNPKCDWLKVNLSKDELGSGRVAILSKPSVGKSPGWPVESIGQLANQFDEIHFFCSVKEFRLETYDLIVLPSSCRNASPDLMTEIIHSGRAGKINILIYKGESFFLGKRLQLPEIAAFKDIAKRAEINFSSNVIEEVQSSAIDIWMKETFWQGVHSGGRAPGKDLVAANFICFSDGSGTFLPADGRSLLLPSNGRLSEETDLRLVAVDNLCEGDLIVLRIGDSSFLLDRASDQLSQNNAAEVSLDEVTDWKDALEALLITHSPQEVAHELLEKGVKVSGFSIKQWAGPDVLGPGDEGDFKALISLLWEKGKISNVNLQLNEYSENKWKALQAHRGLRHRAGNLVREMLFKNLIEHFRDGIDLSCERTSIYLEGDKSTELLILKIHAIDTNPSFVFSSKLCKLENLKGNKWLG